MPTPHRGFNIFGPGGDSVPPRTPAHNPQNDLGPGDPGYYTITNVAQRGALLDADVMRMNLYWSQFQPTKTGPPVYTEIDKLRSLVDAARVYNPLTKLVPVIVGIPDWADGAVSGRYVTTPTGYSQFGQACKEMVNYLNRNSSNYCDFIEISNEPNGPVANDGSNIPPVHYGRMAAHATFWLDLCSGPTKHPLVGALTPITGWQTYIQTAVGALNDTLEEFYASSTHLEELVRLKASWRPSIHAYPSFSATDVGVVLSGILYNIDQLATLFPFRLVWVTETGASSHKLGESGQHQLMNSLFYSLRHTLRPWMEGFILFPLNDSNPYAWDINTPFYKFGVVKANNNDYKLAASSVLGWFGYDWV